MDRSLKKVPQEFTKRIKEDVTNNNSVSGLKDIKEHLCATMGTNFAFYCTKHGSGLDSSAQSTLQGASNQDEECGKSSSAREPESIAKSIHHMDPMFYMYTSGTTGMPKAVIITHIKSVDPSCLHHVLVFWSSYLQVFFSGNFSYS